MKSLKTIFLTILATFCLVVVQGQVKIGQGVSSTNDWIDYNTHNTAGIYVDVNTAACGFQTTPHYLVTLESISNKGYQWNVSGTSSIYNATPTGFRVYLRWTDAPSDLPTVGSHNFPNPLRASTAKNREWVIRWTGIEMKDCGKSATGSSTGEIFSGANGPEENKMSLESGTPNINSLKVFPNPGKERVVIQYSGFIKKSEIYDLNSRLLGVSTTNSINIKKLPKGNYIIKVYIEDDKIITKQFVK